MNRRIVVLAALVGLVGCKGVGSRISLVVRDLPDRCDDKVLTVVSAWGREHCEMVSCPELGDKYANPHCLDPLEHWARTANIGAAYSASYIKWIEASHRNWDECSKLDKPVEKQPCNEPIPMPPDRITTQYMSPPEGVSGK